MYEGTLKRLRVIKEKISAIIDEESEYLLDSTSSVQLKDEMQLKIIDSLNETMDQIDTIMDDIDRGDYEETYDPDMDYD